MALKLLGTREQKENKPGNTGTKAVSREQVTPKSKKKKLLGHKGTQQNFVGRPSFCMNELQI